MPIGTKQRNCNMLKAFLKDNFLVLLAYVILLAMAFSLIFRYDKLIVHIYLNQFVGHTFLDQFFYYITYLGDGLVAPFILIIILLYNVRMGLYSTFTFLTATLFSQLLKRGFFDDVNRPGFVFQWTHPYPLTYVDGVDRYIHNSFPSGHATQAFSILLCMVFLTKNQYLKLLFFALAVLTSLSRVYLSQHWLTDITAGSLIGIFFSMLYYYLLIGRNKFQKLDKPISAFKNK